MKMEYLVSKWKEQNIGEIEITRHSDFRSARRDFGKNVDKNRRLSVYDGKDLCVMERAVAGQVVIFYLTPADYRGYGVTGILRK